MINRFRGEYAFLSNFYEIQSPITINNIIFDSNEHFFQAHKTLYPIDRIWIAGLETPADAKKAGSKKGLDGRKIQLRDDWSVVRLPIMHMGLVIKFMNNYELAKALIATDSKLLVEGNHWHDNYWGDCYCEKCINKTGENMLGLLLMSLRHLLITIKL